MLFEGIKPVLVDQRLIRVNKNYGHQTVSHYNNKHELHCWNETACFRRLYVFPAVTWQFWIWPPSLYLKSLLLWLSSLKINCIYILTTIIVPYWSHQTFLLRQKTFPSSVSRVFVSLSGLSKPLSLCFFSCDKSELAEKTGVFALRRRSPI